MTTNNDITAFNTLIERYGSAHGLRLIAFRSLIQAIGDQKVRAAMSPSTFYRKMRDLRAVGLDPIERRTFSLVLDASAMDPRELDNIGGAEGVERWNEIVLASASLLDAQRLGGSADEA